MHTVPPSARKLLTAADSPDEIRIDVGQYDQLIALDTAIVEATGQHRLIVKTPIAL
jgi:hypothetical protein